MVLLHGEILPPSMSTKFKCNKTALLKQLSKLHLSKIHFQKTKLSSLYDESKLLK